MGKDLTKHRSGRVGVHVWGMPQAPARGKRYARALPWRAPLFPPPPDDSDSNTESVPTDALDAPALERLAASPDEVVPPDAPLKQYVLNEDPPAGVVRDLPFGASLGFGGETPFFTNTESSPVAWQPNDTDGIPTGLPDLLDLPELSTPRPPTPAPRTEVVVQIDRHAVEQARHQGHIQAAVAFVAGAVVAVVAWLIFLSQVQ